LSRNQLRVLTSVQRKSLRPNSGKMSAKKQKFASQKYCEKTFYGKKLPWKKSRSKPKFKKITTVKPAAKKPQ
jgi:hypothetical protein